MTKKKSGRGGSQQKNAKQQSHTTTSTRSGSSSTSPEQAPVSPKQKQPRTQPSSSTKTSACTPTKPKAEEKRRGEKEKSTPAKKSETKAAPVSHVLEFSSQTHPSFVPWAVSPFNMQGTMWPSVWQYAHSRRYCEANPALAALFSQLDAPQKADELSNLFSHLAPQLSPEALQEALYEGMLGRAASDTQFAAALKETSPFKELIFADQAWGGGPGNDLGKLLVRVRHQLCLQKVRALVCNFDHTANLQDAIALLNTSAKQTDMAISPDCQYYELRNFKSMLLPSFELGGPYDIAVLCLSANETRLSINEPDTSGIGFGPFYRKLRALTNNRVAVMISGENQSDTDDMPLSLWAWGKIMAQFAGADRLQVDGSQGLIVSWGSRWRNIHVSAVKHWLTSHGEPMQNFTQLPEMSASTTESSSVTMPTPQVCSVPEPPPSPIQLPLVHIILDMKHDEVMDIPVASSCTVKDVVEQVCAKLSFEPETCFLADMEGGEFCGTELVSKLVPGCLVC
ncbi:hypothetical protein Pelo_15890 [Pelomyxa schiedti]|nr:hypothetical protein Pelo_15890 [Pelomyxa schiedti]